jgi:hypothetical protein
MSNGPEAAVRQKIVEWANQHNVFLFAVPASGFSYRGVADFIGIAPGGKFLAIKAKAPKGVLSTWQEVFQTKVLARGGVYAIVRGDADLERLSKSLNI